MTRSRANADNSRSNTRSFASTSEPTELVDGAIWVDTDGITAAVQRLRWKKTPSTGTTVFTGNNDEGNFSLVYTPNYEEVFLNGVLLVRGTDYAATDGTNITLVEATVAGDVLEVFCTPNLAVTDVYTTGQADARYVPKSFLDAKGDLISASADNAPARIPVGTNGTVLAADSTAAGGVSWQPYGSLQAAGKNIVLNGAFDFNQRNAGAITTGYICDRWIVSTFSGTGTWSRVSLAPGSFANQTANFAIRISSTSSSNDFGIQTQIEDVATLAGQTVTLSMWMRTSAGSANLDLVLITQYFGTGGSSPVNTFFDTANKIFSNTWTKVSVTTQLASIVGKTVGTNSFLNFRIDPVSGLANGSFIEIAEIQLEAGPVATQFTRAGGTRASELLECQKYYYPIVAGTATDTMVPLTRNSLTTAETMVYLPVPMRITPTLALTAVGGIYGRVVAYDSAFSTTLGNVTSVVLLSNFNTQMIAIGFTHSSISYAAAVGSLSFDTLNAASTIALSAEF